MNRGARQWAAAWALVCFASSAAPAISGPTVPPDHTLQSKEFRDCPTCPVMVVIPAGRVSMGFEGGESGRYEGPVREVSIARAFSIGKFEITQGQYALFASATGRRSGPGCNVWVEARQTVERDPSLDWRNPGYGRPPRDDEPVACVSWEDAEAYTRWLSSLTGHRYRLPTEAEWEYAARAGVEGRHPWGVDAARACLFANVFDMSAANPGIPWSPAACSDTFAGVAPVGRFAANAFGLHDVIGNVWEWIADCYAMPYPATPVDGSAQVALGCDRRGTRGGGWRTQISRQSFSFRGRDPADLLSQIFGFRIARDL